MSYSSRSVAVGIEEGDLIYLFRLVGGICLRLVDYISVLRCVFDASSLDLGGHVPERKIGTPCIAGFVELAWRACEHGSLGWIALESVALSPPLSHVDTIAIFIICSLERASVAHALNELAKSIFTLRSNDLQREPTQ